MYKFTFIVAAIAALSGSAVAFSDTCTPGQFYCGSQLLNGSGANFQLWKGRVDKALTDRGQPTDGTHENDSLFFCSDPTTVALDEFCPADGFRCQPANSDLCRGSDPLNKNDCCGK